MPTRGEHLQFLPLKTDAMLVLLVLEAKPRHGYGIVRDVARRTDGETVIQTGALYRLLKRLLKDGLIEEVIYDDADEERRRYYRTTRLGGAVLSAEVERMARLVREARNRSTHRKPRLA
ncbi:MAG: helix-turn-helix transcriptional regulator [Gemmatimonadota bacterium]